MPTKAPIPDAPRKLALKMLAAGAPTTAIVKATGLNRGQVYYVHRVSKPGYARKVRVKNAHGLRPLEPELADCEWCEECCAPVLMPCVACRTREWMRAKGRKI